MSQELAMQQKIEDLREDNIRLRTLLTSLEWGSPTCPTCHRPKIWGHAQGCALDLEIKRLSQEP